uniref:Pecanex-like protein n=1 Tax=Dermatophagoides pteronyssinus TaxID=6956 RepID=A0A6P6Y510_DERPT|nr:pecanex-like protein 4 [Dermatophagoides pteronyssinus]
MNISLISEYKISFILQRIFQTFFGATTTTTTKTASWIIQLFIYLFPSCIGMIISILIDLLLIDSYIGILCVSVFGFIFTMIMNIQPQKSANKTRPLIYDGQWPTTDNQTSIQMFKQNHPKPNDHNKYLSNVKTIRQYQSQIILIIIARSLISCSLLAIFIMIFVWFTFTTVHYSLIIGAPPETTAYSIKFRSIDSILPPIPSLVFYILEQINIILLAGTATCYIWSSFITILFSFTAIILNHFYFTGRNYFLINLIIGFLSKVRYFCLDIIRMFSIDFCHKFYMVITILFTSVMLRKQKIRYSWTIFIINVILLPINIIIIIISSMLNIPILPLFTLPIFLPSFPRPMKFWSTTPMMLPMTIDDTINDAAYYRQLMPRLIDSLHRKSLFWDFRHAGEIMLARFDDRLMWFQVLESGHNYCQIQMKGLELQETSCHTLEASTIDQINEYSFHNNFSTFFNKYFFYAINPMTKATVKTYSDATSVLTGIIDSPDTYVRIKRLFCPIFIWLLLQHKIRLILDEFKQQEHQQQQQQNKNDINIQMVKESQINIIVPSDSVMDNHRSSSNNNGDNNNGERQNHSATSSSSSSSSRNNNNGETLKKFSYDDLQPNIQWTNFSYQISRKRKSIQHRINRFIYSNECQTMAKDSMIDENLFDIDLNQICLQSIRYATKLGFDQMIFAEETLTDEEIINNLKEFDQNWYFGSIDSPEWRDAVLAEKLQLFSISKDVVKEIYQSHMLTLKDMDIFICLINRSVVDAIWSSLSFELFYLTNDDEERYSIQAHQYIFRNLTVQAADPPLGYPVFASEPILISHII